MKKLILVSVATFMSLGAFAQADSMKVMQPSAFTNTTSIMGSIDTLNGKWITMRDGKIMIIKSGKTKMMKKDMTLKDGAKMMLDGTLMKDDSTTILQNGDYLTLDGKMLLRQEMHPNY